MKRHIPEWVSAWSSCARGYVAHCRRCGKPYSKASPQHTPGKPT